MVQKVRIKDVAAAAEVSVGTVSHYMNGRFVSEARSKRIKTAIDELGFTSNLLARSMRKQQSSAIGLCVPYSTFSNFSNLVDALEKRVSDADFELMQVLSRLDPAKEFRRIQRLVDFRVGGLLLVPGLEPHKMLDHLDKSGVPTVIINRMTPDEQRFDQVSIDHKQIMYRVTREFIAKGHRRLLFAMIFPTLIISRHRVEGMREAIRDSGEDVQFKVRAYANNEQLFDSDFTADMTSDFNPTGLIMSNGVYAGWAIQSLRRLGIEYPRDVSLFSLENPGWAELVTPQVSFAAQPSVELAAQAWRLLSERMDGLQGPGRRVLLDADIEFLDF